jgi:hypothetical protein
MAGTLTYLTTKLRTTAVVPPVDTTVGIQTAIATIVTTVLQTQFRISPMENSLTAVTSGDEFDVVTLDKGTSSSMATAGSISTMVEIRGVAETVESLALAEGTIEIPANRKSDTTVKRLRRFRFI